MNVEAEKNGNGGIEKRCSQSNCSPAEFYKCNCILYEKERQVNNEAAHPIVGCVGCLYTCYAKNFGMETRVSLNG